MLEQLLDILGMSLANCLCSCPNTTIISEKPARLRQVTWEASSGVPFQSRNALWGFIRLDNPADNSNADSLEIVMWYTY